MHLLVENDQLVRGMVGIPNADPAYPALDFGHQAYMMVDDQRANASADSSSLESPHWIILVSWTCCSPVVKSNQW